MKYNQVDFNHFLTSVSHLTLQEKKDHSKIRTKMTDVKSNLKNKHESLSCDKCGENNDFKEQTQEHVYQCMKIGKNQRRFETIFTNTHEIKKI